MRIDGQTRLRDKISLYGQLGFRNKLFRENHAKDCQEIEELRRICREETDRARQARIDELPVRQERNPTTVSQLLAQFRIYRTRRMPWSMQDNFSILKQRAAGAIHVPGRPSTIASPWTMARCDSGLPHDTRNFTGIMATIQRIWHLLLKN